MPREGPGEHGEVWVAGEGCFGGPAVVRVTGEPAFVEDEEKIGTDLFGLGRRLGGQLGEWHCVQRTVGMIEMFEAPNSAAAARSSARRSEPRPSPAVPRVDASPRVKQSTDTAAPREANESSTAPSPKLSSSGWAHTANTDDAAGKPGLRRASVVIARGAPGPAPARPQLRRPTPRGAHRRRCPSGEQGSWISDRNLRTASAGVLEHHVAGEVNSPWERSSSLRPLPAWSAPAY